MSNIGVDHKFSIMLVVLLLVSCSFEPPTHSTSHTPIPPTPSPPPFPLTDTPTQVPPTATSISSLIEFGQSEELGQWKIKVVNSSQAYSITTLEGSYSASDGRILHLVELEFENTADATSTLYVDPHQIEVVDSEGETHMSIGGAPGVSTFLMHIYHVGGTIRLKFEPPDGGPAFTLISTVIDDETKEWTIELAGKGSAKLTMAFNIPSDAQVKELRWPELQPFSLEQ